MIESQIADEIVYLEDQELEQLSEIFEDPCQTEMLIKDIESQINNSPAEDYNFSDILSSAFYQMNAIQDIAKEEMRNRKNERKEMLREAPEYQESLTFLDIISSEQYIDYDWAREKLTFKYGEEIAELAISDFRED